MKTPHTRLALALGLAAAVLMSAWPWIGHSHGGPPQRNGGWSGTSGTSSKIDSLQALIALPVESLENEDIARMNLLCAAGLPRFDASFGLDQSLAKLDEMAMRVRTETERHMYRFRRDPAEFEHSEGFFRMTMLGVVLAEDFGVHYVHDKRGTPAEATTGDGFFADSRDVFLHGCLGERRAGTCSSLPVLYVAVGRRLGYPLTLVTTSQHLFVRWNEPRERFNIEATGRGVNRFSDDYYRHWPSELTDADIKAEGYLKSLTPPQELAVFLSIRGMCWREAGQYEAAASSFRAAARLAPHCRTYRRMAAPLETLASKTIPGGS